MNQPTQQIRIGLSQPHACSYLANQMEQVAVVLEQSYHYQDAFEMLLANGFRRSGNTIYKPHCRQCQACQAIRVSIPDFTPSKSQKRLNNKCQALTWQLKQQLDEGWYSLYERYITARHSDGSMYPPNTQVFHDFAKCGWLTMHYLHIYEGEKLVAVAVTDVLSNSASAFYTFFDPDYPLSLGTYAVLCQIELCQQRQFQWLYLGYQIDECAAMNYKTRFVPHQRLVNQRWQG
ncbi:arginyltransferase [Vibrio hippocampi]|uniref:Aspartate/glutamate leucyltransferase n=1 Tax=Vibrio hippocampi TaxID=654686 RepID=A0ABM8ZH34_9VIBR|nr:arginyltransferase [Vibrio hippocampi]CAH0525575.1 Aspartate/glutamate leucyltransferase [Vibrio hippocampi]